MFGIQKPLGMVWESMRELLRQGAESAHFSMFDYEKRGGCRTFCCQPGAVDCPGLVRNSS